jgi:hypothetical protein
VPAIEIYWRRGTAALMGSVALLLAVASVLLILLAYSDEAAIVAVLAVCAAIFGWVGYLALVRAREGRPLLVFSADGLSDPTGIFMVGDLPWSKITGIETGASDAHGLRRLRIALASRARPEPLSLGRRAVLYTRSGSTPGSINVSTSAVSVPAGLGDALRALVPPSLPVT